ncbi:MAG TPA: hypothetical protein PKC87_02090, partial [Candidatus Absconditabacterales bacterium]|nr:hypothetical protein [Candidatus Absconditabacterales bacterium]
MLINLTCIFLFLAGIYFAIITYRATKKKEVFFIIGIFLFSLYLEAIRLHQGSYKLGLNDVLWTSRDILWTGVMIYFFQCM